MITIGGDKRFSCIGTCALEYSFVMKSDMRNFNCS